MPVVNLRLHIVPEQMYCANCSTTIRSSITAFLKAKPIDFSYISTDYRKKTVEIADIALADNQTVESFVKLLIAELNDVGYECTGYDNIDTNLTTQALSTPTNIWPALPLLAAGTTLMLAEHLHTLPHDDLAVNLPIGFAATAMTFYMGQTIFKNAWRTQGAMDTLISLGTLTALSYSFLLIAKPPYFDEDNGPLYFSLPLMMLGFLKLSHGLRDKIHAHIEAEMDYLELKKSQLPRIAQTYLMTCEQQDAFATLVLNPTANPTAFANQLEQLSVDQVVIGSILSVEKNALIPIDSFLLGTQEIYVKEQFYGKKGNTLKKPGDVLYAGSENTSGQVLYLKTFCLAQDNHLKKAYDSSKAPISADAHLELISHYFLRGVLSIALLSALGWGIFGPQPAVSNAIKVMMAVLLSACPCGLGLIGINASMIKGLALKEGILIQQDNIFSLDQATDICLDKCGTLTTGNYALEKIIAVDSTTENHFLAQAMLVEQAIAQDNPTTIANAIIQAGKKRQVDLSMYTLSTLATNATNKGRGGTATINENKIAIGNKALLTKQGIAIEAKWLTLANQYAQLNRLPVFLSINNQVQCLFILQSAEENNPLLRSDVKTAIEWLIAHKKTVHILTGDNEERTQALLRQLNINVNIIIRCEQKPQDKIDYVARLNSSIMVGDDTNDLGALNQATYSLAIDTLAPVRGKADAVLNGTFTSLIQLMCLAKTYRQSYHSSLVIAFGINGVSLLAAAGVFYPLTQQFIDPMITGMAMIASSLLLLLNIAFFKYLGENRLAEIKYRLSNAPASSSCTLCPSFKRIDHHEEGRQPLLDSSMKEGFHYPLDSIV